MMCQTGNPLIMCLLGWGYANRSYFDKSVMSFSDCNKNLSTILIFFCENFVKTVMKQQIIRLPHLILDRQRMELICLCAYYGALMAIRVGYDEIVGPMLKHARSVLSCIRLIYIKCSLSVSPSLFSLNVIFIFIYFDLECFSSPEPKVSFSDHNLSIVHCYCPCKLFTFSSCPEPLGQFQPNSTQSNYPLLG